jgi:glycosyltransferase involved in cell wall biosynthesis
MRVAFNAMFLLEPRTGTCRYVYNLLSALSRVDGVNQYRLLTPREPAAKPDTSNAFTWQTVPVGTLGRGGENIGKLVWEQRTFPMAAKRQEAQVMHVPYFAPPLRTLGIPTIVTVHDVIALRMPEYRTSPAVQAYTQLIGRAAKRAAAIIAVSEHTKADIMEVLQIPAERIRVIREAPEAHFRPVGEVEKRAARAKYGLGPRFILNVGGIDVRKNIATLIGAFATIFHSMGDRSLQLCIAGDPSRLGTSSAFPDWRPLAETFGIADRIICTPIREEDLPAIYSAASCFVFTSLYEGFGLTPLEAMACGAPVVCSNATSLPEVVGVAATQVDARDPEAVAAGIQRVLESPETAQRLREWGLAHVRNFSWDRVAAETSALYADVAGTTQE